MTAAAAVLSVGPVRLFATPWTVACQAPVTMGFLRQEYRSGLPFPPPEALRDLGTEPSGQMESSPLSVLESPR